MTRILKADSKNLSLKKYHRILAFPCSFLDQTNNIFEAYFENNFDQLFLIY